MADDYVYAISDAGIRVATLPTLQTPVATVLFPRGNDGTGGGGGTVTSEGTK